MLGLLIEKLAYRKQKFRVRVSTCPENLRSTPEFYACHQKTWLLQNDTRVFQRFLISVHSTDQCTNSWRLIAKQQNLYYTASIFNMYNLGCINSLICSLQSTNIKKWHTVKSPKCIFTHFVHNSAYFYTKICGDFSKKL